MSVKAQSRVVCRDIIIFLNVFGRPLGHTICFQQRELNHISRQLVLILLCILFVGMVFEVHLAYVTQGLIQREGRSKGSQPPPPFFSSEKLILCCSIHYLLQTIKVFVSSSQIIKIFTCFASSNPQFYFVFHTIPSKLVWEFQMIFLIKGMDTGFITIYRGYANFWLASPQITLHARWPLLRR